MPHIAIMMLKHRVVAMKTKIINQLIVKNFKYSLDN